VPARVEVFLLLAPSSAHLNHEQSYVVGRGGGGKPPFETKAASDRAPAGVKISEDRLAGILGDPRADADVVGRDNEGDRPGTTRAR